MALETEKIKSDEIELVAELVIRPQSAKEEYDYLWYVLKRIPFYQQNGYSYEIPNHKVFQEIARQSPCIQSANSESLFHIFTSEVYNAGFFEAGIKALESQRQSIIQVFPRFKELNSLWGFKIFPKYQITVTKYGPGGMFLENEGRVIMMTRQDGTFKRPHPTHTAVHEMVHMGIEEGIVEYYRLDHWEKERMIDRICLLEFNQILPGYQLQASGDARIDPYITAESIGQLPQALERFVKEYPRA